MIYRNTGISILSIAAEASYLYLLYSLLAVLIKIPANDILTILQFLLLAMAAALINCLLLLKSWNLLTLSVINITLISAATFFCMPEILFAGGWDWLFFNGPNLWGSLQVWLTLLFTGLIFIRAMIIVNSNITFQKAVNRLEITIGILWGAVLIAELISIPLPHTILVLALCLVFNLSVVALTRTTAITSASYLTTLGIFITLIIFTTFLLDYSQPFLLSGSHWVYNSTFPYIGEAIIMVLSWLLKRGHYLPEQNNSMTNNEPAIKSNWSFQNTGAPEWLHHLTSVISAVAIVLLIIIVLVICYYLIRSLMKKRSYSLSTGPSYNVNLSWVKMNFYNLVTKIKNLINIRRPGNLSIELLYKGLLYWGKRRNIGRKEFETPYEYSTRLAASFPKKGEHFHILTDAYVKSKYGQQSPGPNHLKELRAIYRRLSRLP